MRKYFDTHAHLHMAEKPVEIALHAAKESGVVYVLECATDVESSKKVLELQAKYPEMIKAGIGIHPEILVPGIEETKSTVSEEEITDAVKDLEGLVEKNISSISAIGECGLDYYWLGKNERLSDSQVGLIKANQRLLLSLQLEMAAKKSLPIIIHSRGAEKDSYEIVTEKTRGKSKVVFHSYTGGLEYAKKVLEEGYFISFNGIVTFPKADLIRAILDFSWKNYPDQVLAETDTPLLAPIPHRGEKNEPAFITFIVQKMAEVVGEKEETIAEALYINSEKVFSVPQ